MAYCTEADVKIEFKNILWDTPSGIASTTVTEWCDQESAVIDAYLSKVYTVPITGTQSLKTVKKIAIMLVTCRVKKTLQVKDLPPATQDQVGEDCKKAYELLEDLVALELLLSDAILIGGVVTGIGGVFSNVSEEGHECVFKKEETQW